MNVGIDLERRVRRVLRFHAAVSGLLVFNEHKLYRPLNHRRDLENKVQSRSHQMSVLLFCV